MDDVQRCRKRLDSAKWQLEDKEMEHDEIAADIAILEEDILDLEDELDGLQEIAPQGCSQFFSSLGGKKHTIVRDEHDKLRYTDKEFEILLLANGKIYGSNDFMLHADSVCEFVGEIHWCDGG